MIRSENNYYISLSFSSYFGWLPTWDNSHTYT